jgi:hypothetical protein
MDQPEVRQAAGDFVPGSEWMPPSAALAHFEPPEGTHLVTGAEANTEARARYGYRVGELGLLIDADVGSEVLSMPQIASLPRTPPGFLGLINLRGNLVPLYELGDLLSVASRRSGASNLVLVFGQGEQAVGVMIESYPVALPALRALPNLPQLPEKLRKHVPACYVLGETVWLEFDHGSFFDEICRDIR